MAKIVGIIPARYQSTRLPGKPLALLDGKPMVVHVYERVQQSRYLDDVVVATDDQRIIDAVEHWGGKAVLTATNHATGTDRLAEVARDLTVDLVVNIQGDEPLINPLMIDQAVEPMLQDASLVMSTLKKEITDRAEMDSPHVVKVVTDQNNKALYFSRSLLPYPRTGGSVYKHVGLYVYRKDFLLQFSQMAQTPLEKSESLEQLRVLENGYPIYVAETSCSTIGVDTPEDLQQVETLLKEMNING